MQSITTTTIEQQQQLQGCHQVYRVHKRYLSSKMKNHVLQFHDTKQLLSR